MYFAVSWFEPRLVINKTALEWFEAKTGPPDVSDRVVDKEICIVLFPLGSK